MSYSQVLRGASSACIPNTRSVHRLYIGNKINPRNIGALEKYTGREFKLCGMRARQAFIVRMLLICGWHGQSMVSDASRETLNYILLRRDIHRANFCNIASEMQKVYGELEVGMASTSEE
ncbi:hypothetical protein CY34DRAFT_804627 [Suillus luteus UH-Slu-Lm8-n1]|uniref:Uncharacterized protein n=1 Tax=Suillus luteus UH-Slu-Lm8-n1 TaxID=930992 RepID=A0A0D0ALF9_9AGAM|nr:hypothetical protein CY34DRAFT_804627 [Suillus luteus UH-Slu-Lm8-n1]